MLKIEAELINLLKKRKMESFTKERRRLNSEQLEHENDDGT